MKLAGKVCVVTGGVQGIGRAIVEQFAAEGGRPAILDLDAERAVAYAEELRGRGVDARGYGCDVADRDSVFAAAELVSADLGRCDVLVDNAGVALMGPSVDFPESEWRRSIDVMQTGVFFCCQAFGRQMIESGGEGDYQHRVDERDRGVPLAARLQRRQGGGRQHDRSARNRMG